LCGGICALESSQRLAKRKSYNVTIGDYNVTIGQFLEKQGVNVDFILLT